MKMSERRCTSYSGPMDADVAFIAQSILAQRYEEAEEPTPPFMATISSRWRDPATPTVSAATDAVTKQIEAGALPRNSVVALERMGYSDADIRRVQQEWSQESFRQILAMASKRELPEDPLADELARQRVE